MKSHSSLITLLLALLFTFSNFTVASQQRIDFNGLWRTGEDVLVNITHSGSRIIVHYVNPGDCASGPGCVLGGGAEFYLQGTANGNEMEMTMMRCTHDQDMRDDGLSERYTTTCTVSTVTDKLISGTYRWEYYQFETRDGKRVNYTRDPGGDGDAPFSLTRTNCKEELKKLVAEIDRKAETLKEQKTASDDVSKNTDKAIDGWYEVVADQLKDDAFQEIVPPSIRVVPGAFEQDLGGYIESWVDFVEELAQKGGNFALEKAAKIVGLYDLLIDWGNVNAKGLVTLDEVGQMNNALSDMYDSEIGNILSWINAMLEYQKLRELCAGEIPPDKQPKPKVNHPINEKDREEVDQLRERTNTLYGSISSGLQSAKTELSLTANAIGNLQQLLEPYRNADKSKTMEEVMTADGIKKLQNGLIEAGRDWINVFRQLKTIEENRKKLSELSKPAVG